MTMAPNREVPYQDARRDPADSGANNGTAAVPT